MAIGIVSFGIVVIFALLPTGLNSVKDGKLQEIATDVLALAADDLRNVPRLPTPAESSVYGMIPFATAPEPATVDLNTLGVPAGSGEATLRLRATPRPSANPDLSIWHLAVEPLPQSASPPPLAETVVVLHR